MKWLLALAPALLLSTAALAQEAPEAAKKDLWCGIAFNILLADVRADAPEETKAQAKVIADGSAMLIERATAAHMEAGFNAADFATHKAEQEAHVAANMAGPEPEYDYKYQDCADLLGL
jgi:hypothetical protein